MITDFEAPTSLQGTRLPGDRDDPRDVFGGGDQLQLQQGSLSEHRKEIQPALQEASALLPPVYRY